MENQISIRDKGIHIVIQDMKQPLTNIMLASETLHEDNLDEETQKRLSKIIFESSQKIKLNIEELCKYLEHGYAPPDDCL